MFKHALMTLVVSLGCLLLTSCANKPGLETSSASKLVQRAPTGESAASNSDKATVQQVGIFVEGMTKVLGIT